MIAIAAIVACLSFFCAGCIVGACVRASVADRRIEKWRKAARDWPAK